MSEYKIKQSNSNEMQDIAAAFLLGRNKNFLDLGAGGAKKGNNTYLLQKKLGWEGCCFDLREEGTPEDDESRFILNNGETYKERGNTLHNVDCTTPAFLDILKENAFPQVVDYISLDVDMAGVKTLKNLIEGGYIFKFLTYEHDLHYSRNYEAMLKQQGYDVAQSKLDEKQVYVRSEDRLWNFPFSKEGIESRKYQAKDILKNKGYFLLFEDVSFFEKSTGDTLHPMEDWWINPQYFPDSMLALAGKNLHFIECIKQIFNACPFLHDEDTFQLIHATCLEEK
tara:strand:+ start:110 stop:955 length:846 start_codon:yes stop_codon:yes gene_type:complete